MENGEKVRFGVKVLWFWMLLFVLLQGVGGAIPQQISYQGYLTNGQGVPVGTPVDMTFTIYDSLSGGNAIWSETQNTVPVINGIYNVILGSQNPLNLPFEIPYFLGITIGAEELSPRRAITSVGYSFRAYTVDVVPSHGHSGADITSGMVAEPRIDAAIARITALTAHTSRTDNPHATTAGQVGAAAITHAHSGADITAGTINNALFSAYSNLTAEGYLGNAKDADLLTRTQADSRFVNEGQANSISSSMITAPINLTGSVSSAGVISGSNSSTYGYGLSGSSPGTSGRGVYGTATATGSATNYGGYFEAAGNFGIGVVGLGTGTSGRGVYASASGGSGTGVYGYAGATGAVTNYGGFFSAAGNSGQGVHGEASGNTGRGVYGHATGTGAAINHGGYFQADGNSGTGVYGYASVIGAVTNYGGYFLASGNSGVGVYGEAIYTGGYFIASGNSSIGVRGSGSGYDFYAQGSGTNFGPFTGGHDVKLSEEIPANIKPGMIVSVTGKTLVRKRDDGSISISSTLPTVKLSKATNDKAVFGVVAREAPLPEGHWYEKREGERFAAVNALGEGRVLVTNLNGNIEAGDYITTSNIPGYGQKQDDDILRNYTLGKAIETVDWDAVTETVEYNGQRVKVYLIGVVYTSG